MTTLPTNHQSEEAPVTFHPNRRWPAVACERRVVIPSRTEGGEDCTVIVLREEAGPLKVYFHGARQTSMAPSREEVTMLLTALADAAR